MGTRIKDMWFHGRASRQDVEALVRGAGVDGSFAVRCSETISGAYSLSLLHDNRVFTYRVLPTGGKLAVQTTNGTQKKKFASIDDLVAAYRTPNNGLACALTNAVAKAPSLPPRNPQFGALNQIQPMNLTNYQFTQGVIPSAPPTAPPSLPPRYPTQTIQEPAPPAAAETIDNECSICCDAVKNAFLEPCGHVCCCEECAKSLTNCPICRKRITNIRKAYIS